MAQGRGSAAARHGASAVLAATGVVLLLAVLLSSTVAYAAKYTVGDSSGWTFGVSGWTNGKKFKAGDVLSFNYLSILHNVVVVDAAAYQSCTSPANAVVYSTGRDNITLSRGSNYFICSIGYHCQLGMKIYAPAA